MNPHLQFDFSVNKEENTVTVKREFAAGRDLVWAAWTQPELMDQWWAPRPYKTRTKSMDFREGGFWLYNMIGPDDTVHYCRADYTRIVPREMFSGLDGFCNEEGEINAALPRSLWTNSFQPTGENTLVTIVIAYETLADLEMIIEMGFKEGFTMAMENLDELIQEGIHITE